MNDVVLLYIIVSLVWLVILIISDLTFSTSFYSVLVSILFLVLYIPIAYYYISQGEQAKVQEALFVSIVLLIIYTIAIAAQSLLYLRNKNTAARVRM